MDREYCLDVLDDNAGARRIYVVRAPRDVPLPVLQVVGLLLDSGYSAEQVDELQTVAANYVAVTAMPAPATEPAQVLKLLDVAAAASKAAWSELERIRTSLQKAQAALTAVDDCEAEDASAVKGWPRNWPAFYDSRRNVACDMLIGPCACGACHGPGEFILVGGVVSRQSPPPGQPT